LHPRSGFNVAGIPVTRTSEWMKQKITVREFFRVMAAASTTVAASTIPFSAAVTEDTHTIKKQRARYKADSPDVQTFYRVNRYPTK
jgi:hypothetical protein